MIILTLWCCVTLMNDWYDGPLAERTIALDERGWRTWTFRPVGPDADAIRRLAERLEHAPIHVLAPDNPHAGYGLQSGHDGRVFLVQFNWLIAAALEAHPSDIMEASPGLVPPPHEALAWALAALRSMGIEPDPDWEPGFPEHGRTWAGILAHDAKGATPYDPSVVRYVLELLGAQVPEDLALVAPWVPPPPPPESPPKSRAEIRAELVRLGLPIPPEYAEDSAEPGSE